MADGDTTVPTLCSGPRVARLKATGAQHRVLPWLRQFEAGAGQNDAARAALKQLLGPEFLA